jgi:hypothetical protein
VLLYYLDYLIVTAHTHRDIYIYIYTYIQISNLILIKQQGFSYKLFSKFYNTNTRSLGKSAILPFKDNQSLISLFLKVIVYTSIKEYFI